MFIAIKTDDGERKGKISFYCRVLQVSRQAFSKYLKTKDTPWKYQAIADAMPDICNEDECNNTYGRIRMYQALQFKQPEGVHIPSERTVYRVMEEIGLNHRPKRKPNGITKADKKARKSDDLIKRDFTAEKPLENDQIQLLQTLPGIAFLSSVVLIAEMDSFNLFDSPKKLYAYFGMDPAVKQSGKFTGDKVHMSKRGSSLARRILHMIALNNLKLTKGTKAPVNPVGFSPFDLITSL